MRPLSIGRHRQRVTIQALNVPETRDTFGQPSEPYITIGTFWAEVRPLRADEALVAKQVKAQATHRVIFRWLGQGVTLNPTNRLIHNGRIYGITEVLNVEERNRAYVCTVHEIQQTGKV